MTGSRPIAIAAGCGLTVALACGVLRAAQQREPVFRAMTSGIAVDVTVNDGRRAVLGLTAADFILTDNGVPQQVSAATLQQLPFDLTLVIDTSGSLSGKPLEQLKSDVRTIGTMLGTDDRLRVVTFATRVTDAFGWQTGGVAPPVANLAAGGATAFHQALTAALLRPVEPGRRQLMLALSDGADTVSLLDASDVRELARRADGVLHIVLRRPRVMQVAMSDPSSLGGTTVVNTAPPRTRQSWGWVPYSGIGNTDALRDAAEATGGRLRIAQETESLVSVFETALDEFRTGYVLWYTPAGVTASGWHTIAVKTKTGKYSIRARSGYDGGAP